MNEHDRIREIREAWHSMEPWERRSLLHVSAVTATVLVTIAASITWLVLR